jgi:hypothetical protein
MTAQLTQELDDIIMGAGIDINPAPEEPSLETT